MFLRFSESSSVYAAPGGEWKTKLPQLLRIWVSSTADSNRSVEERTEDRQSRAVGPLFQQGLVLLSSGAH